MQNNLLHKVEQGVIGTVTKTIKSISSLPGKDKIHSGAHLTLMNLPHWLAKRNASFHGAISIIQNNLESKNSDDRNNSYQTIIELLEKTKNCHQRILINLERNKKKRKIEYLTESLSLISNMLSSASLLCASEKTVNSTTKNSISESTPPQKRNFISTLNLSIMDCEKNIFEAIIKLIPICDETLQKDSNKIIKLFNKSERLRFNEAYKELKKTYSENESISEELT